MLAQCPIAKSETAEELRLEWDNRKAQPDRFLLWFLLLFWIFWVPGTAAATWRIFHSRSPVFLSICCIFCWLPALGIPYLLLGRSWYEWVTFRPNEFVHGRTGRLAPKPKRIPLSAIAEIGVGHYDSGDHDSVVTLNIHYFIGKKLKLRHMVGHWLHPSLKEDVFRELQAFANKHDVAVVFQRY